MIMSKEGVLANQQVRDVRVGGQRLETARTRERLEAKEKYKARKTRGRSLKR